VIANDANQISSANDFSLRCYRELALFAITLKNPLSSELFCLDTRDCCFLMVDELSDDLPEKK